MFLGRDFSSRPDYSEDTARQIDAEVREIVIGCYERAKKLLQENFDTLKRIADALMEYETLDADDVEILVQGGTITRERPKPRVKRLRRRRRRRSAASSRASSRCRRSSRTRPEPSSRRDCPAALAGSGRRGQRRLGAFASAAPRGGRSLLALRAVPMILARPIALDRDGDLEPAWERLGLEPAARQRLLGSVARAHLLLTGLGPAESRLLREQDAPGLDLRPLRPGAARGGRDRLRNRAPASTRWPGSPSGRGSAGSPARWTPRSPPARRRNPTVLGGRTFRWGERTHVMGVVNVTPDSFSDGGRHLEREAAVRHGARPGRGGSGPPGHRRRVDPAGRR